MKLLNSAIKHFDQFQKQHGFLGFPLAVVKKYSEDEGGHQAALLTYYGFLALFPLLLVLTTLTGILAPHHSQLQQQIINGTTNYFPVLGQQLADHIHSLHRSGWALAGGLLFTLYGARGVAQVFSVVVNKMWGSKPQSLSFLSRNFKSLVIIGIGGIGLIGASVATGLAASAGHGLLFRVMSAVINLVILFVLLQLLLKVCLPSEVRLKQTLPATISVAIGFVILQTAGSYLLRHELKHLDALYSYFALSLGVMFWIYLQAQVLCYSLEVAAVKNQHLWPRSIT